jgi:predicted O-methyltransferase YrrM
MDFEFAKHIETKNGVKKDEAKALFKIASNVTGIAVEIGSYIGRSSSIIASGLKEKGTGKLFAIDPWESRKGHNFSSGIRSKMSLFIDNVTKAGCIDYITPVMQDSYEVLKRRKPKEIFEQPIEFLFVDGNHKYEGVRKDLEWIPLVKRGGIVAFHDYGRPDIPAPTQVINEYLKEYPNVLKFVDRINHLIVFTKL